jgi:hypothetical protein
MAEYKKGSIIINNATAAAATVTATLTAPPVGMVNKVIWVCCYATAATLADLQIQRNDGTLLCRLGGADIRILSIPLVFGVGSGPQIGMPNDTGSDAMKLVLTTTGGTNTQITVGYVNSPG